MYLVKSKNRIVEYTADKEVAERVYAQEKAKLCNPEEEVRLIQEIVLKTAKVTTELKEFTNHVTKD